MSSEVFQAAAVVVALYGLLLCFVGYRVFRAFLAAGGLAVGVWAGLIVSRELRLEPLPEILLAGGAGLLLAWLAAAVYYAGLFLAGGIATTALVWTVGVLVGNEPSLIVLGAVFCGAGLATVLLHKRLVIYLTALGGALLVMLGSVPLLQHTVAPEQIGRAWVEQQLSALTAAQLGMVIGLALLGSFVQRRFTAPGTLSLSTSRSETVVGEPAPGPRAPAPRAGAGSGRTHEMTCPRCGERVDPDALFCDRCGNDFWE